MNIEKAISTAEEAQQQAFLEAFAEVLNIIGAAEIAGVSRSRHYEWLKTDEAYKARYEELYAGIGDALEREAIRRGLVRNGKIVRHGKLRRSQREVR